MNERTVTTYWIAIAAFLAAGLFVWPPALFLAMAATLANCIHYLRLNPGITAFPMQVRVGFLGLLIVGQIPYLGWVNWVQMAGITALLTIGYCPLARILSLMPWNRTRPMSWNLFVTAIFSPPGEGSILRITAAE